MVQIDEQKGNHDLANDQIDEMKAEPELKTLSDADLAAQVLE